MLAIFCLHFNTNYAYQRFIETLPFYCFLFTSIYDSTSFYQLIVLFNTIWQNVTFIINFPLLLLLFFEAPNYHKNPYIITKTQGSFRVCIISPIFQQHFSTNKRNSILSRKPLYFHAKLGYYHGNSRLLPDSTIFPPIAILSAASKITKKWGSPTTLMNPSTLKIP